MTRSVAARASDLVEQVAPDLLAYFMRRVEDPADAADLLSETFLVIARRPSAIPSDPYEARLWAFGVARRTLSTGRRAAIRRTALIERLRGEARLSSPPLDETYERLHLALAGLDPLDREIIRLVHWDGFSQVDVARILRKPAGTVSSRYTRARAQLRTALATSSVS